MKKAKKIIYPFCFAIILIAVWNLWKIKKSTEKTEELYAALASQAEAEQEEAATDQNQTVVNPWLLKLQQQNRELAGWIRIPGTEINYPVMQTESDNDYYLTHDFNREENVHGALFLDVNCSIRDSENLIIYGHNMKDGTMFQNLMGYKDADYCNANGRIRLDLPEESSWYQLLFVMLLSEADAEKFPYYKCIDLSNEEIYQGFLTQCSRYAIWQNGSLPEPGTRLLTLSTCEYSEENGRLVVVAQIS